MPCSDKLDLYTAAMVRVQSALPAAAKDRKNELLNSRFADLAGHIDVSRPLLTANGFTVTHEMDYQADGEFLLTRLDHVSGQWRSTLIRLQYGPGEKGRTIMQSFGSAFSYARRFSLMALVGTHADDDDGQGAGAVGTGRHAAQGRDDGRREPAEAPRGRDERRRQPAAAAGSAADRGTWADANLGPYIDAWHAFDPIADGQERTARESRLLNAIITTAIKDDVVDESRVTRPGAAEGKPRVRIPAECWNAIKWVRDTQPDWFRLCCENYINEKRAAAEAAAADRALGSQAGAA